MNEVTPQPRVAILGTGKMGSAIAGRLSGAGFELTLWNRTRERAHALGIGQVAETPTAAARNADVIISSLTGPDAVRAAYLGPSGALSAAKGKLIVEMSTAGPDLVADLAKEVAAAGARLVDAPILGAPPIVLAGEAAILISGAKGDVAAATPVLAPLGTVRHVGTLGKAARLKLVANSMLADVLQPVCNVITTTNIWGELWAKLVQNSMSNPIAGVSSLLIREIRELPEPRRISIAAAAETSPALRGRDICFHRSGHGRPAGYGQHQHADRDRGLGRRPAGVPDALRQHPGFRLVADNP